MNNEFEILSEGFRYDLWANRQWWAYLQQQGIGEPDISIFRHILGAQEIWHQRCIGNSLMEPPVLEVSEAKMVELNGEWVAMLTARGDDPLIHFHRFDGIPHHLRLSQIARHVVDHGTYHRGELRGLCRGRDATDFPETGLAGFVIKENLSGLN